MLLPMKRAFERLQVEKSESDTAAFYCLLYIGELLTKLTVCGVLSGVTDDRDRHKYSQMYALVRADGIGEWATALDALLTGPTAQYLLEDFHDLQTEITQRQKEGSWQRTALALLQGAMDCLSVEYERPSGAIGLRMWFHWFALLRNKTRGHGATLAKDCSKAVPDIENSIRVIYSNLSLFKFEWAYLHRNLSGRYRVTPLSENSQSFANLKSTVEISLKDGIYIFNGTAHYVDLIISDPDVTDFFVPNGQYRSNEYEVISYLSNMRRRRDSKEFSAPPSTLPESETQGKPILDLQGSYLGNIPDPPNDYVLRTDLENKLIEALLQDRHEIVTLSGPGGIGKTSLAINALKRIGRENAGRFDIVIWFSARDIDLLPSGPKQVRPHGISIEDFAMEYIRLTDPAESKQRDFKSLDYFASVMSRPVIGPTLYVFDNFETVVSPAEVYKWLDTYVRAPNKILITTRTREFTGDLPIEVLGLDEDQANILISSSSTKLGISSILDGNYRKEVFQESGGHPYVIKIMLGEIQREGHRISASRIIASQEFILQALFERTFSKLTPAARRVFFLLSSWRSVVPSIGVEAVLMRSAEERFDVTAAIDELKRLSLIEELQSKEGKETFLSVPLAAMTFGKKKLTTSPLKVVIEADTEMLRAFGAAGKDTVDQGVESRIGRLLRSIAAKIASGVESVESVKPMLEFIASRVPSTWIGIARLYREQQSSAGLQFAREALQRYLESNDSSVSKVRVWSQIADICRATEDQEGELHALVEMAESPGVIASEQVRACQVANILLSSAKRDGKQLFEQEERRSLLSRLERSLGERINELDATDLSKLAWLNLHIGNDLKAASIVTRALSMEPANEYCISLAQRGIGERPK